MGRHKRTEKRSYIPRSFNGPINPFATLVSRLNKSDMTLQEYLDSPEYVEFLKNKGIEKDNSK